METRTEWLTICAIFLALQGSLAAAAIFEIDDRITIVPHKGSPFAAIGTLSVSKKSPVATGFLVSNCHVLSVQHVHSDRGTGLGKRLTFRSMLDDAHGSRIRSVGTIIAGGGFDDEDLRKNLAYGRSRDWLLLRLDRCLGKTLGFVDLVPLEVKDLFAGKQTAIQVESAGVPGGGRGLRTDPSCAIRGATWLEVLHDCATLRGNSGSPIFEKLGPHDRRLRVLAMTTSAHHGHEPVSFHFARANRATSISHIFPLVHRAISQARNDMNEKQKISQLQYNFLSITKTAKSIQYG